MPESNGNLWKSFCWTTKSLLDAAVYPRMIRSRNALNRIADPDELVRRICNKRQGRGAILANQNPNEIGAVCRRLMERPPKTVVEIGTAKGGTLYLWSRLVQPGGLVISIDKPGGPGSVRPVTLNVYRSFGLGRRVHVHTLARDSHAESTHAELRRMLDGRRVDFLFIDGDHSYEGAKADFWDYQQFLAEDALIGMHDIGIPESHPTIQVGRVWSELCARDFARESIVADPGASPGIGLVFFGKTADEASQNAA